MATATRGVTQVVKAGDWFGKGKVIDPDIRLGRTEAKPWGYRYARMQCVCGSVYLAQISHLFHGRNKACPDCVRKAQHARRRRRDGLVYKSGSSRGYNVWLYVGYYTTQREADEIARRSRAVILPETPPIVN